MFCKVEVVEVSGKFQLTKNSIGVWRVMEGKVCWSQSKYENSARKSFKMRIALA